LQERNEEDAWQLSAAGDAASTTRQRAWITTAEVCDWLGISRETLRHRGCTQGNGPLQWHLEHVEATITGLSRRNLRQ
jgi:hypothetical protein